MFEIEKEMVKEIQNIPAARNPIIPLTVKDCKMANENEDKNVFDIEFEKAPEKGKQCHMQVDHDLHTFLNQERLKLDVTFRKLANELLCKGIQQYIKAKKMPAKIRDRSKY